MPEYGYIWARIHLHVPTNAGPLALAAYPGNGAQFEVFVNGSPIVSTPGMATRTLRFTSSLLVALPPAGDMVLAIRFNCGFPLQSFPLWRARIGSVRAIHSTSELFHLRYLLDSGMLANCVWLCVVLLLAITALILYRAQRKHDEYLWLGLACLASALYTVLLNAFTAGWVPATLPMWFLGSYAGWICNLLYLEFVVRFCRTRRGWPIWILQGFLLVGPVLNAIPLTSNLYVPAILIAMAALCVAEIGCLFSAYRRGMTDAGLLLAPILAGNALNVAWIAARLFPAAVPCGTNFHFGPVGISDNLFAAFVFMLGIVIVALYRFLRVARNEERAAAELEAARTVQQILVPDEVPTIPGFSIQAVYQPAGEVGGDFYQVLPTPNGGLFAVIGDVSGKGMPAAMTVSLLVGTVRTLAHYTQDPAAILTAMNQRMIGRGTGFTTCLVLRLDSDGTLIAANAGHLAPYANGKELSIDNGLPLGITAAAAYGNTTLHLGAATTLTLLTDGVVEAQNAKGELFGFERAAAISSKPAQSVAEAAQAFGQEDDITVLSLALVAVS